MENRIRLYREKAALTIEQLSERSGCSVSTIKRHENGIPDIPSLLKIAAALGVPVEQLLEDHEDEKHD